MKHELVEGVVGFAAKEAEAKVLADGHEALVVSTQLALTDILRPNTVILWEEHGKIVAAEAGNPLELDNWED